MHEHRKPRIAGTKWVLWVLGGFYRHGDQLERQDSVCACGCACGKEMSEEAVSPPNWCVGIRLATFCLNPSCAAGPVVATLICEFFSTSVHLCCVQLCLCSV